MVSGSLEIQLHYSPSHDPLEYRASSSIASNGHWTTSSTSHNGRPYCLFLWHAHMRNACSTSANVRTGTLVGRWVRHRAYRAPINTCDPDGAAGAIPRLLRLTQPQRPSEVLPHDPSCHPALLLSPKGPGLRLSSHHALARRLSPRCLRSRSYRCRYLEAQHL